MVHVMIDGIPVEVEKGTTVLHAAKKAGIEIPTLCYIEDLIPDGSCRLCVVEVKNNGRTKIDTSCTLQVSEGDEIFTRSEKVRQSRKQTLDLLLSDHNVHCFSCEANGDCKLQEYAFEYGLETTSYEGQKSGGEVDDTNKFFTYDPSLCILCHRCVNTCNYIVGRGAIETMERGFQSIIGNGEGLWKDGICESCGNCVQACPTGALSMRRRKKYRTYQVEKKVLTTCPHCAAGCQLYLLIKDGKIVDVEACDGPSNKGLICAKGRNESFDFIYDSSRITDPMIKNKETGELEKATWEEALNLAASRLMELKKAYGSEALSVFAYSNLTNEELYMVQKMAHTCLGINHAETDACPQRETGETADANGLRALTRSLAISGNAQGASDMGVICTGESVGSVKGMYICGEIPEAVQAEGSSEAKVPENLEFLVVQSAFLTETAKRADVILPGITYAEKEGTFTNRDHLVQRVRKAVTLHGNARTDIDIIIDLMNRCGCEQPQLTPAEVMDEIAATVPGYENISYAKLDEEA